MTKETKINIDALKETALQLSAVYGCGVKIEIDAINNSTVKNCNIWVKLKVE